MMAICCPKFPFRSIKRMCSFRSLSASSRAKVPSLLPSFMNRISHGLPNPSMTGSNLPMRCGRASSSLYTGMTIDTPERVLLSFSMLLTRCLFQRKRNGIASFCHERRLCLFCLSTLLPYAADYAVESGHVYRVFTYGRRRDDEIVRPDFPYDLARACIQRIDFVRVVSEEYAVATKGGGRKDGLSGRRLPDHATDVFRFGVSYCSHSIVRLELRSVKYCHSLSGD